jgi:DNA-binding winged helix-turn-helix (wHTH) protein
VTEAFEFGPFRMDPAKGVLWRGAELVPLTPKAFALLRALVQAGGDVVLKSELMDRVWPDTAVEEANLSVTVAALRRALGDREDGSSWIETVPRRGYRFATPRSPEAPAAPLRIAVLPFRGIGHAPEPYLGLGMADALIARLTGVENLRVRPTGAVAHLAHEPIAPIAAAEQLDVDAVLDGTHQRDGARLRLAVQFLPRGAGLKPWAAQFESNVSDVFSMQDDLAERVVVELRSRLGRWPGAPHWATRRTSLEAWEAWLRGCYFWVRLDPEGLAKAVGCFGEAAVLDPAWAPPHAGLAASHVLMSFGGLLPPQQTWSNASDCVARALELDPGLPAAHLAQAWVAMYRDWAWREALAILDRAVAIGPRELQHWRAFLLALQGDLPQALRAFELGREADPLSAVALGLQGFLHFLSGEHEQALAASRRGIQLRPDHYLGHWHLARACFALGRHEEGLAALQRAADRLLGGLVVRCEMARALAEAGRPDEARELLAELDALSNAVYISPFQRARILTALGDTQPALLELERALQERDPWVTFLRVETALDPLRALPRFERIVQRVFS